MPEDFAMANPFASTHSLDANPFDDPPSDVSHANRLEDLNRRERELQNREQELSRKADNLRRHGRNNFPPCMSFSVFLILSLLTYPTTGFPLIFHSIADEIPETYRPLMTRLFQIWLLLLGTLVLNLIACIFILLAGSSDGGRDVGASAMYSINLFWGVYHSNITTGISQSLVPCPFFYGIVPSITLI